MKRNKPWLIRLQTIELLAGCPTEELELFDSMATTVRCAPGRVLMRQGGVAREWFVLAEGSAIVERDGELVSTLEPGTSMGELALLGRVPRRATVTITSPSTVLVLNAGEFSALMNEAPTIRDRVLGVASQRLGAENIAARTVRRSGRATIAATAQ